MQYLLDKQEYDKTIASTLAEGRKQIVLAATTILSGDPARVSISGSIEDETKVFLENLKVLRKELDTLRSKGSKNE